VELIEIEITIVKSQVKDLQQVNTFTLNFQYY